MDSILFTIDEFITDIFNYEQILIWLTVIFVLILLILLIYKLTTKILKNHQGIGDIRDNIEMNHYIRTPENV